MFKTAKFQIRPRRYQPNLTFDLGGYVDYWRLWILAGTALAVLKFGVCGCRPSILAHKDLLAENSVKWFISSLLYLRTRNFV